MKKCPPGVICIENVSMFFIFVCILIIAYIFYSSLIKQKIEVTNNSNERIIIDKTPSSSFMTNFPYNNNILTQKDVLKNPYEPPLSDERYVTSQINYIPPGKVPINVSTNINAVDTSYRQVGIITPLNTTSKDNILALMGRPLYNRRDLWQYYTISNQHNDVKLPISVKGKSATNEYGVDRIYNGDTIYVEGYNQPFKVTIYDNDTIKYLPFI